MMKNEFEIMIGYPVTDAVFERVNDVYMNMNFFKNKEQVKIFWDQYDLNGFERLYSDLCDKRQLQKSLLAYNAEVAELKAKLEAIKAVL